MTVHILGIDPGLVHTGCVRLTINVPSKTWFVNHAVFNGLDLSGVQSWADEVGLNRYVFIEAYRPRSHFGQDAAMAQGVAAMRAAIPGSKVLDNTGVKRVVRPELMKLLGVWNFHTPTHHQDLRSAARIGLYGAMKIESVNTLLATLVASVIDNDGWNQI